MHPIGYRIFIGTMALIVLTAIVYLVYTGLSYYMTPLEERFYHPGYGDYKPSGVWGHGLGILGSLAMLIGVTVYMIRKRVRSLARLGRLKHWLEFHMFLCILGPVLVLFHTSFKFGGLVAVSFWSMVAVFLSGFIGRFIYVRIPRSIEGRELSLGEIREMKNGLNLMLKSGYSLDQENMDLILESIRETSRSGYSAQTRKLSRYTREDRSKLRYIKRRLKQDNISQAERSSILRLVKNEISINHSIERLQMLQNIFRYWHVAHLPFAFIMLIIMIVHVVVALVFGYTWIFAA